MTLGDARFVDLYQRYYRHVYAYCRRRTAADKVEDAVAETFLVVWRKIGEVPPGDEALPWLYSVAHRVLGSEKKSVGCVCGCCHSVDYGSCPE